ncbi:MAG: hypothetical protein K5839_03200, partial [Treponemataceae bacterium]|nr:hypothetical protein [Treponemataceae bacterium]
MTQKEILKDYISKIKSSQELQGQVEIYSDLRLLWNDKELKEELDDLLEGGCEKEYDFYPFAEDFSGGVYVLVDDKYIALIDSEGGAGYVAESVADFFKIILNVGMITQYTNTECLEDFDTFHSYHQEMLEDQDPIDAIEEFIDRENLKVSEEEAYELLKNGITIMPPLEIVSPDPEYGEYHPLICQENEEIENKTKSMSKIEISLLKSANG